MGKLFGGWHYYRIHCILVFEFSQRRRFARFIALTRAVYVTIFIPCLKSFILRTHQHPARKNSAALPTLRTKSSVAGDVINSS